MKWVRKNYSNKITNTYVMEATGVYYEELAYHLHKLKFNVVVLLPNKVKHYAKSLNVKFKTDKSDSKIIAQMGVEQQLRLWNPPAPIYRRLRLLTRLYEMLTE